MAKTIFRCFKPARGLRFAGLTFSLLILAGCAAQRASDSSSVKASTKAPSRVISPEVGADQRVTFRLRAPEAQAGVLTGEFIKGTNNLAKGDNGVWSITVGPIEPEIYSYNFTIDGGRPINPGNANVT